MKAILNSILWYCSSLLLFGQSYDWPKDENPSGYHPEKIRLCDEVVWMTPTYVRAHEYMMIKVTGEDQVESLGGIFSKMKSEDGVETIMIESNKDRDDGFLIFKKSGSIIAVFQVESHVSNKRSVRWCEWLLKEDQDKVIAIIRYGGLSRALIASEDFRKIINSIERPDNLDEVIKYKVYWDFK